jgi:hypothetical protein
MPTVKTPTTPTFTRRAEPAVRKPLASCAYGQRHVPVHVRHGHHPRPPRYGRHLANFVAVS